MGSHVVGFVHGGGSGVCMDMFAVVINGTNGTREKWSQLKSRISVKVHFC